MFGVLWRFAWVVENPTRVGGTNPVYVDTELPGVLVERLLLFLPMSKKGLKELSKIPYMPPEYDKWLASLVKTMNMCKFLKLR